MESRPVRTSSAYSISLLSQGKESNFEELMVTSNEVTGIPTMAGDGPKQLKRKQDVSSDHDHTGKSLSEALILGSTNPHYDKRLSIDHQFNT